MRALNFLTICTVPNTNWRKKDLERENLLRTIPGGFARPDARKNGKVIWYGAGFLDLIGYTADQFEQELHSEFRYLHPED